MLLKLKPLAFFEKFFSSYSCPIAVHYGEEGVVGIETFISLGHMGDHPCTVVQGKGELVVVISMMLLETPESKGMAPDYARLSNGRIALDGDLLAWKQRYPVCAFSSFESVTALFRQIDLELERADESTMRFEFHPLKKAGVLQYADEDDRLGRA